MKEGRKERGKREGRDEGWVVRMTGSVAWLTS